MGPNDLMRSLAVQARRRRGRGGAGPLGMLPFSPARGGVGALLSSVPASVAGGGRVLS